MMKPGKEARASVMKRCPTNALVFWTYPVVHQSIREISHKADFLRRPAPPHYGGQVAPSPPLATSAKDAKAPREEGPGEGELLKTEHFLLRFSCRQENYFQAPI